MQRVQWFRPMGWCHDAIVMMFDSLISEQYHFAKYSKRVSLCMAQLCIILRQRSQFVKLMHVDHVLQIDCSTLNRANSTCNDGVDSRMSL